MVRQLFGRISADFEQIFVHIESKFARTGGLQTRFLKFTSYCGYPDVKIYSMIKTQKKTLKAPKRHTTHVDRKKMGGIEIGGEEKICY